MGTFPIAWRIVSSLRGELLAIAERVYHVRYKAYSRNLTCSRAWLDFLLDIHQSECWSYVWLCILFDAQLSKHFPQCYRSWAVIAHSFEVPASLLIQTVVLQISSIFATLPSRLLVPSLLTALHWFWRTSHKGDQLDSPPVSSHRHIVRSPTPASRTASPNFPGNSILKHPNLHPRKGCSENLQWWCFVDVRRGKVWLCLAKRIRRPCVSAI